MLQQWKTAWFLQGLRCKPQYKWDGTDLKKDRQKKKKRKECKESWSVIRIKARFNSWGRGKIKEETLEKESGMTLDKWLLYNFFHPYSLTPQWEGQHGEFALVSFVRILLQLRVLCCHSPMPCPLSFTFLIIWHCFFAGCSSFLVHAVIFILQNERKKIPKQIVLHCEQSWLQVFVSIKDLGADFTDLFLFF